MVLKVKYKSNSELYSNQEQIFIGENIESLKEQFFEFTVWLTCEKDRPYEVEKVWLVDKDKGIEREVREEEYIEWL